MSQHTKIVLYDTSVSSQATVVVVSEHWLLVVVVVSFSVSDC